MYIIPMLAVCNLKRKICKEDNVEVIEQLAYLLCAPHGEFILAPFFLLIYLYATQNAITGIHSPEIAPP